MNSTITADHFNTFERMSRDEVANLTGIPVNTLNYWATMYPARIPFYKFGRRVWYNRSDVMKFIESCKVNGGANE